MLLVTIIFILTVWVFVRTLSCGIYEIKQNSNTIGGIITIVLAATALIFPNLILYINGFY